MPIGDQERGMQLVHAQPVLHGRLSREGDDGADGTFCDLQRNQLIDMHSSPINEEQHSSVPARLQ